MIVSQFQSWAEQAPAPSRADGVSALARAYLYSDLSPEESAAAVSALTRFLDDPSLLVRRAMADAFASAAEAPHHIILALTEDQPSVASIILSRSPVLTDAELIEILRAGDNATQSAIAARPYLSSRVVAAIVSFGDADAVTMLAHNGAVALPDALIREMIARHRAHAPLREALLARGGLSAAVRADLVGATASALAAFVTRRSWISGERMQRVAREAIEKAAVGIAAPEALDREEAQALASQLRESGQLTVALIFRALLSGNLMLFEAILSELSGVAPSRVEGLTRHFSSAGFAALYRKAGLPAALLPAFCLALTALREFDGTIGHAAASLSVPLIRRVLADCRAANDGAFDKLIALMRRFEAEAERDAARAARRRPESAAMPAPVAEPARVTSDIVPPARAEAMALEAIQFDEAVPMNRALPMPVPDAARVTIDLAALEAELMAAA